MVLELGMVYGARHGLGSWHGLELGMVFGNQHGLCLLDMVWGLGIVFGIWFLLYAM